VDFVYYGDSDEEEEERLLLGGRHKWDERSFAVSCNFVDCLRIRENGDGRRFQTMRLSPEYGTRHMLANSMLRERPLTLKGINKVNFCNH
jgi:hypothetical protein